MADMLTRVVQRAIRQAPCSTRSLALAAGVPQSTLARILSGERAATRDVADPVAKALDTWSKASAKEARAIRRANRKEGA